MPIQRFAKSRSRWIYPAFPEHNIVFCGDWGRASTSIEATRSVEAERVAFALWRAIGIACDFSTILGMTTIVIVRHSEK